MRIRITAAVLLAAVFPGSLSRAQTGSTTVGWYNGDRASPPIPGYANWYLSAANFARIYDDFVVPAGGWTVVAVFSNNSLNGAPPVTQASWEIRSGVSQGNGGTLVASGLDAATSTHNSGAGDDRIQVDGLNVQLAPGTYWLSVTPVGAGPQQSWISATLGAKAVGTPPGNNGGAFINSTAIANTFFAPAQSTGAGGTSSDFSQGILIAGQGPPPLPPPDQWRVNVTYLMQQMPLLYSLPFPGISLGDFKVKAAQLYTRIPSISDAEIRTGIQALVASIEDPHTDVGWGSPSPFRFLPLSFFWFDDGLYITGASAQYQDLLGASLVSMGQAGIDDVTGRLATLVPHENDSWMKYQVALNKLSNTDFLFGTGITADPGGAAIVAQTPSGDVVSENVQALNPGQGARPIPVFQGDLPLYRQHPDKNYWAAVIDDGATVYFQYNSCNEDSKQPSADFFAQLDGLLAQDAVQRVIVDMRNNTGGFVAILNPWIDSIKASRFNSTGRLYVIVGRATFSAAMYASDRFRQETAAIFVGEPTGGKPRFMNRKGDFPLPYYGIRVSYSNGVMNATDYGPTLMPDIQTPVTFQDYMHGADPALDAILSQPLPDGLR